MNNLLAIIAVLALALGTFIAIVFAIIFFIIALITIFSITKK